MKRILTQYFLLSLYPILSLSQTSKIEKIILKGLIADKETNQPLAYVSIGLLEKPLGTISDSNGNYILTIFEENKTDTIQLSLVGYTTKRFLVSEMLAGVHQIITMDRKDYVLPDIVISNRNINTRIIGRQSSSKLIQISIHNKKSVEGTIGSEMGMRIKTNQTGSYLKDLNWYFSANNFNYIKFRVNVYSVKNNMPDTLLTDKQIFAFVEDFKTGWIKFNLEPYNIRVSGEFIITLQWVESSMEKKEDPVTVIPVGISFSKNAYARVASQDKWKRMGYNLSYYVTLMQ
jgi:hypothetical protein